MWIDIKRQTTKQLGLVLSLTRDIHRTSLIALIKYSSGSYSYILAPLGLVSGFFVKTVCAPVRFTLGYYVGYNVYIGYLELGDFIYNIGLTKKSSGIYARSAGTFCRISHIDEERSLV